MPSPRCRGPWLRLGCSGATRDTSSGSCWARCAFAAGLVGSPPATQATTHGTTRSARSRGVRLGGGADAFPNLLTAFDFSLKGAVPMSDNRTPPPLPGRKLGSFVLQPTPRDIDLYTNAERHVTCASCAKFRLRAGQEQMQRERFLERLVRENEWRIRHLGAPPETFGLCAETSDTITSMYSRACEHYRPANGRLR